MKPEYPAIYAKASTIIATPLIGLVAFFYVTRAITEPASEVYAIGLTAFGVTAGLSAICFSVPDSINGSSNFRHAGEKFLHSSVLLVQTVMIVYLKDFLTGWTWLNNIGMVGSIVQTFPVFLISLISGAAAVTWHLGFGVVDAQLWQNWKQRIEEVNKPLTNDKNAKN